MKRSCHPFLLNLPLMVAGSASNGFTVTRRDEKNGKKKKKRFFFLQRSLNKIKTADDKSIPPRRINRGGIPSPS